MEDGNLGTRCAPLRPSTDGDRGTTNSGRAVQPAASWCAPTRYEACRSRPSARLRQTSASNKTTNFVRRPLCPAAPSTAIQAFLLLLLGPALHITQQRSQAAGRLATPLLTRGESRTDGGLFQLGSTRIVGVDDYKQGVQYPTSLVGHFCKKKKPLCLRPLNSWAAASNPLDGTKRRSRGGG